ncbi:MAG: hypothetical protein HYZ65_01970, partial [Burkholderiales bacterium]|nr:hypothetical protein [Burkholderiales bacterium]
MQRSLLSLAVATLCSACFAPAVLADEQKPAVAAEAAATTARSSGIDLQWLDS